MRRGRILAGLLALAAAVAVAVAVLSGGDRPPPAVVEDASVERGRMLIDAYGCGACHAIPGIDGADARIGPSLEGLAGRRLIAGELPNDTETLVRWLMDPPALDPGTVMPDLGVSAAEARDLAAYLYSR